MNPSPLNLVFREAIAADIPDIVAIHNANVRNAEGTNPNGFLLAPVTPEEIQEKSDRTTQYSVATLADQVVGFVALSHPTLTLERLADIQWLTGAGLEHILKQQPFYIEVIATRPGYTGSGVGRFLYSALFGQHPKMSFSAFVVVKPITNDRSLRFHQSQGFVKVGRVRRTQFLDLQNYESVLLLRDPP